MPAAVIEVRRMEIPTYVVGPDSPYPSLMTRWEHGFYPYSVQLDIRTDKRTVKHRVVVLENEYVQAIVLPDMGGRLYSLFDKVAGQHTFMVPPSIKYQNISMRGAWIAGGIEWNFGHRGHNVSTVNPVSWKTVTEPDGTVAVYVGATVRPLESRWSVKISLKPQRAAIDVDILTMAPQSLPGLMYWWSNSAVEVGEQSKFYYFGHKANGHAIHSWPICGGLDYSWWRNRLFGSDMFLMEPQRDYMGFYDFSRHHGLAQTASRYLAPGQKYFTWGVDPRGRFWDWLLSDSEQTYCEIQRGRLETQGVTEPIPPMSVDGWSETWLPINRTEGFGGLENDMVISVNPDGDRGAVVRLLTVVPRKRVRVEVVDGEKVIDRWTIDVMRPGEPAVHAVKLAKGQSCKHVKVYAADGAAIMDWTEFEFKQEDWTKHHKPLDLDKASVEELFIEAERRRFDWWPYWLDGAVELYEKILKIDAGHTGALAGLAQVEVISGRLDKALERIEEGLKRRPLDPGMLMTKGWILVALDRTDDAVAAFMHASRYEPNRRNGLIGAVSAQIRAGRFAEADRLTGELIRLYPNDRWAMLLRAITLRKTGRKECAAKLVAEVLRIDPVWSRATAEAFLLGLPAQLAEGDRHLADDSVTAAGPYLELGLWEDAAAILSREESDEAFSPAVRLAHLAYAQFKAGDKAALKATLKKLRQAPVELAHPWSNVSVLVLSELAAAFREEPMVHLMLGNILSSRRRQDDAKLAWQKAISLGLEHTVVYRNLAAIEAVKGEKDAALGHYRKAWKLATGSINLFVEFDRFLAGCGRHKDREKIYQQLSEGDRDRSIVALRRVPGLLDAERYDEALKELTTRTFLAGEGAERITRIFWVEALQGKAVDRINKGDWQGAREWLTKALDYPRNLNVGRQTTHPGEATVLYMLGLVAEAMGQVDEARQHYTAAVNEVHFDGEPAQAYEMLAWLALGQWPRAMKMASLYERIGRGEAKPDEWGLWFNGRNSPKVGVGFAELVKGRLEAAREVWEKVLEEEPDARWIRPLLRMNDDLLRRMYARSGEYVATVWADSVTRVERLTDAPPIVYQGATAGSQTPPSGNGQVKCDCGCGCDCSSKTGKVASKPATRKIKA